MRRIQLFLVATTLLAANQVFAFGSPAEAGAAAWCGARSRGASIDEANKQLRKTMASEIMMSTSFAAGMVGILSNKDGLKSQIDYHISRMCPGLANELISGAPVNQEVLVKYSQPGVIGIGFDCLSGGRASKEECDEVIVSAIAKGGPADLDGRLRQGDRIIEVNGQRIAGKKSQDVVRMIGGEPGTYVIIVVKVSGENKLVTLKRAPVEGVGIPK